MWGAESFLSRAGGGGAGGGGAAAAAAAVVAQQQHLGSKSAPCSPVKPFQKRAPAQPDSFHVIHKVPLGDSPYVKAKHVQLVDKDPDAAIALFWAAINAGDRVDSALKDMAIVMKQQNRPEEAIEAIKSLRYRCSDSAQESLDNVLLDLYKRCGRLDDQISLLKHKLHLIHQGMAFNGKRTKTARSQGKKFQVSIEQEATRLLGNLGWAYMQQSNFLAAEAVYRKALSIGPDNNKVCNLGICLMKQGRLEEAKAMLQSVVPACPDTRWGSDSHLKSYDRAQEMLVELESSMSNAVDSTQLPGATPWLSQPQLQNRQRGSSCNASSEDFGLESIAQFSLPSITGALSATAGFGPSSNSGPPLGTHKKSSIPSSTPLGYHQQAPDRPASQDGGRSVAGLGGAAPNTNAGRNYHRRSASYQWDEYDLGYTSPDENVDANLQQAHLGFHQQHLQSGQQHAQWAGEGLKQKQDSLGARKLERSLTFGGPLSRADSNSYNNHNSSSFPYQAGTAPAIQRAASENFSGKVSLPASPLKPPNPPLVNRQMSSERAPLTTYDRTNSVTTYAAAAAAAAACAAAIATPATDLDQERVVGAANHFTSGWGTTGGANHHHHNSNNMLDLMIGSNGGVGPLKSTMGNSELSFFSRWGYNGNQHNRPMTRRSLSLETFDAQLEQIALENDETMDADVAFPPPPLPSYLQLKLHPPQAPVSAAATAAAGATGGHVKRPRNQTPVKEKNSNSNSLWNSLGFTLCPDALNGGNGLKLGLGLGLELGQQQQPQQPHQPHYDTEEIRHMNTLVSQVVSEGTASPASSSHCCSLPELQTIVQKIEQQQQSVNMSSTSAQVSVVLGPNSSLGKTVEGGGAAASLGGSDTEMIKRQRRLRVFQEITLFPGSPQHVGV